MPEKTVNNKIADFGQNDEYADLAIFGNFEGDENTRQIYTIWNIAKATTREWNREN